MKDILYILPAFLVFTLILNSCEEKKPVEAGFEDQESMTIYDYMMEHEEAYSSFLSILEAGEVDKTLSAYNPYGINYTLFLPGNDAIEEFIRTSDGFSTLEDVLKDREYSRDFGQYHVVLLGINSNDFPFGALPEYTMSGDLLTVNFIIEKDSSYYKINNQARVIRTNIELSNGYVHIIKNALTPVNFTTYEWLEKQSGFSIFKEAVDNTGLQEVLNMNLKDQVEGSFATTLLIEPDTVYHNRGIFGFEDLVNLVSPDNTDFTNPLNPLNTYVAYHILTDNNFLVDFEDRRTNYSTYSDIPLLIDGQDLDIAINKGKEIFDTIINTPDTVLIDYIGFDYDASNVITESGAIHIIDQVMRPKQASREVVTFQFFEEPLLNEYRLEPGEYLIEDTSALYNINWYGADLIFHKGSATEEGAAWNGDYLFLEGDFVISYTIPKVVPGKYRAYLGADLQDRDNAVVEVFIDGKNQGALVNLATGGTQTNPFARKNLGTIDFIKYTGHTIEIRVLIPGSLYWDYIRFEPI